MSDKPLAGKIAVVTGSSRGIGRGIAVGLGELGATVYVTGRTMEGELSIGATAALVDAAGGVGVAVQTDHSVDADIEALFAKVKADHGRLDVLVNNVYKIPNPPVWGGKYWEHPMSVWDDQVEICVRGGYIASRLGTQIMVDTADTTGLIVNISSGGAENYMLSVAYGIAKSGTDRMSRDMAVEAKDEGIAVVGLWPSQVMTEFIMESVAKGDFPLDEETAETPLYSGRVIAQLAADDDRMSRTGQVWTTAELAIHYDVHDERDMQPKGRREPKLYREPI